MTPLRWRIVINTLGLLLCCLSLLLAIPLLLTFIYSEDPKTFLYPSLLSLLLGVPLLLLSESSEDITVREAFLIVYFGWLTASFIGALPYLLCNFSFTDAFFESTSGFTGTGATIIENIEAQPKSLLFWRSFSQWIGGMGIIVLFIAIFPKLSAGGRYLFSAEAPGIEIEKVRPRIKEVARIFWGLYLFFTAVLFVLLLASGMSAYDSVVHTFSTLGTGGFSSKNLSIGAFSPAIQYIIALFMFLASTNFILHYRAIKKGEILYLKDEEFRFYSGVAIFSILVIALLLHSEGFSLESSLRLSFFQVISIMSATGFSTADFNSWPWLSKLILFLLMFMGGCANSTAGGMKAVRVLLSLKYSLRDILKALHPSAVISIRLNGKPVEDRVLESVISFIFLYLLIFIISSLIISSFGYDLVTSLSAVITCLSNVGPGLGLVGPAENFSFLHPLAKFVLSFCMIAGRLEVLPVLILLYPRFWKE